MKRSPGRSSANGRSALEDVVERKGWMGAGLPLSRFDAARLVVKARDRALLARIALVSCLYFRRMRGELLLFLALVLAVGCADGRRPLEGKEGLMLVTADDRSQPLSSFFGPRATVVAVLDPECPLARMYAPVLDSLARRYAQEGVAFLGVHPSSAVDLAAFRAFAEEVITAFPQVRDTSCALAQALKARVLPQVFLFDAERRSVYEGAVDDRAVRAGRKKPVASKHYLHDALGGLLGGVPIDPARVEAVGCLVECAEEV